MVFPYVPVTLIERPKKKPFKKKVRKQNSCRLKIRTREWDLEKKQLPSMLPVWQAGVVFGAEPESEEHVAFNGQPRRGRTVGDTFLQPLLEGRGSVAKLLHCMPKVASSISCISR